MSDEIQISTQAEVTTNINSIKSNTSRPQQNTKKTKKKQRLS